MSRISVLVENSSINNNRILRTENGLSLFIGHEGKNILFDTGRSDIFLHNAKQLNIDIGTIDYLIISHSHFDHGGGLSAFLNYNTKAKVYLHNKALQSYYTKLFMLYPVYIGINKSLFSKFSERIEYIDNDTEIANGINILTGIKQVFSIPLSNKSLFVRINGKLIKDTFDHEIILTISDEKKLIVFSGCSHSGILNILEKVKQRFPEVRSIIVIGGFQLDNPSILAKEPPEYIINLANKLDLNEGIFYTGHCTGEKAF